MTGDGEKKRSSQKQWVRQGGAGEGRTGYKAHQAAVMKSRDFPLYGETDVQLVHTFMTSESSW